MKGFKMDKKKSKAVPKPRNPFTLHLIKRPSGPQEKTYKAKRKILKQKGHEEL